MQVSYRTACAAILILLVSAVRFQGSSIVVATADEVGPIVGIQRHAEREEDDASVCTSGGELSDYEACVLARCPEEVIAYCATVDECYDFTSPVIEKPFRPDYCPTILDMYESCSDLCR